MKKLSEIKKKIAHFCLWPEIKARLIELGFSPTHDVEECFIFINKESEIVVKVPLLTKNWQDLLSFNRICPTEWFVLPKHPKNNLGNVVFIQPLLKEIDSNSKIQKEIDKIEKEIHLNLGTGWFDIHSGNIGMLNDKVYIHDW